MITEVSNEGSGADDRSRPGPGTGGYDVAAVRRQFPSLDRDLPGAGAAHFDGPGGTQTPAVVGRAMAAVLTGPLANRGVVTVAERNAEQTVTAARQAMADLLGVDAASGGPRGIVFGRSMTQLTMDLARTMAKDWGGDDEVVVTRLDHDADVRPWVIAAGAVGATVRFADFDAATGELDPDRIGRLLTPATRLVAVTGASNLIGTRPDLPAIADLVHGAGAKLFVDGVHLTAHAVVDVAALGVDFYACSPYKFCGPHCGVLWGRPELLERLRPDKLAPSTDAVPERFELGTLPYELLAGTTAAVDFLAGLAPGDAGGSTGTDRRSRLVASLRAVEAHEDRLRSRIETSLGELPGVTLYSRARHRTPTLLLTVEGRDPQELRRRLAERGVNAPAGSFYAYEPARHLGLGEQGGLRVGLAPYNDDADVDRLLEAMSDLLR